MMLTNPEARRGLRSVVQAIVGLVLLFFVWLWADRFTQDTLREAMRWCLGIVAIGTVGYQFENGMRALKLKVGEASVEAEAGGNDAG